MIVEDDCEILTQMGPYDCVRSLWNTDPDGSLWLWKIIVKHWHTWVFMIVEDDCETQTEIGLYDCVRWF